MIQELCPETPPPTTQATTPATQQPLRGSYPETPVPSRPPSLLEFLSLPSNMQDYLKLSDNELESERDSVPTNPIAGPSTPPPDISTTPPSAHKSFKTACLDEVPEPLKQYYESCPKSERRRTQLYS